MMIKMFRCEGNWGGRFRGLSMGIFTLIMIVSLTVTVFVRPAATSGSKDWPTKPITLIVAWSAGGGTDVAARTLATKMSQILGVAVSVVNKPGGSGIVGTLEALKSPPDGYTLFMDSGASSSIQYAWFQDLPYKAEERTYIARTTYTPQGLIVPASSPWKTVDDLVNAIRTNPSSVSFALLGGTGVPDVNIAQFRAALTAKGLPASKTLTITFKGIGEVLPALAGGHVKVTFSSPSSTQPLISAGKIRVLALAAAQRYKDWPTVPTMAEVGFPSVDTVFWVGLSGPPGLPANVIKTLDNAIRESLGNDDFLAKLDKLGLTPAYQPGDTFRKFVFAEGETIKALKLK
jgi:tripartite-type tricarboxylate transporter receptor subunit TctC